MKKFDRELLLDCATELLSYLALQDPMFADRIEITKSERSWDDLQCILSYCGGVLERGEHMYFTEYEFMQPGYVGHLGPRPCDICKVEFTPGRGLDTVCSKQECLDKQAALLDAKFEKEAIANG